MKYVIWGWAVVFDANGNVATDPVVLSELAQFIDPEDLYQTDYIGGTPEEDAIAEALDRSGQLRFFFQDGSEYLRVLSTFIARRTLSDHELNWLRENTLGQWSDGMGECLFLPDGIYKDYKLQPLDRFEVGNDLEYPYVELVHDNA